MFSDVAIIIPARIGSTRLERKALKLIGNAPVIEHVYKKAAELLMDNLYVATDSDEIADAIHKIGGKVIMTDANCQSGTDRVYDAFKSIKHAQDIKYIVNLQGDQPFVDPKIIKDVILKLKNSGADIATPVAKVGAKTAEGISKVKVVIGDDDRALYFSRNMIPYGAKNYLYHIGIYAFQKDALAKFVSLPKSFLEESENLEQLRALESGMRIVVSYADSIPISIDTKEDLEEARKIFDDLKRT